MRKENMPGKQIIDSVPNGLLVFAIIILLIFGAILGIERMGEESSGRVEYKTYASEGYGFSFSYPSSWIIDNMERLGVLMVFVGENASQGRPNAGIQIYAGNLGIPPLDNVRGGIASGVEDNENLTLTAGPENVMIEDVPGLDFTLGVSNPQGNFRMRRVILKGENSGYDMSTIVMKENLYENFKTDIDHVFESFTLLKK